MRGALLGVLLVLAGCGGDDGDPAGEGEYAAYNLFTGAPRFGIFKADPERDLCVRVVFIWGSGTGTADLGDALAAEDVTITSSAADCDPSNGGGAPSLEPQGVPAASVSGTVSVTQTGEVWTVTIDGEITFPPDQSWVPESEPLDAADVEIVGGCC
jgi:hypothetical protein